MYMALRDKGDERRRIDSEIDAQFGEARNNLRSQCNSLLERINGAVLGGHRADRSNAMMEEIEEIQDQIEDIARFKHLRARR